MKSRVNREFHARICEGLGVKFPGATRPPGTPTNPRFPAIGSAYLGFLTDCFMLFIVHFSSVQTRACGVDPTPLRCNIVRYSSTAEARKCISFASTMCHQHRPRLGDQDSKVSPSTMKNGPQRPPVVANCDLINSHFGGQSTRELKRGPSSLRRLRRLRSRLPRQLPFDDAGQATFVLTANDCNSIDEEGRGGSDAQTLGILPVALHRISVFAAGQAAIEFVFVEL